MTASTPRRRPRHATVVAYVALFFAMTGTAAAATGGTFLLGRSNAATSTTTLSNSRGTPLSLKGPASRAPLAVTSSRKVAHLNADLLDGFDSSNLQLRVVGGCAAGSYMRAVGPSGSVTCGTPAATPPTPPPAAASCPAGQAIQSFNNGSGSLTCVAVSTGSNGPSSPAQGSSKQWTIASTRIYTDIGGNFAADARITNDATTTRSSFFTITLFSGQAIVTTLTTALNDVEPGGTYTASFSSTDKATSYDSWTFQAG